MIYSEKERDWIRLSSVEGIGLKRFTQLLEIFKTPRAVLDNPDAPELAFLGRHTRDALKAACSDAYADALFERLERAGCYALAGCSCYYPERLGQIYDPPAVLYVRGNASLIDERMFSIVGSRRCTRDGMRAAGDIAAGLAREGVTVVSGLARGIDTAAHEGALKGGGRTIAVFGCGPDIIYPPENDDLARRILETGGALVSEYLPGSAPQQGHFPARNRIISGLTRGTLLVEGAKGSGAMITVRDALDQDRDVFAVPGSIYSPLSSMPNQLIVEGARPVLSAWEILEAYRWAQRPGEAPTKKVVRLDESETILVRLLKEQALSFSELQALTKIPVSRLNSYLTILELRGIIVKNPGGQYRAYPDAPL